MKLTSSRDYSPHPLSHDPTLTLCQQLHHSLIDPCRAKTPPLLLLTHSILQLELYRIASIVHNPHAQFQLKPLCNYPLHKVHI